MSSTKISAVLITLNAEYLLEQVLKPLSECCDEIILVDSGSVDNTIQIAKKYNCKTYYRAFDGYGNQKRYAVGLATHNWVLSIDADEIITTELKEELATFFEKETIPYKGIYIPRTLVFMEKVFNFGNEHKQKQLRLFNKSSANFNTASLHEKIEIENQKVGDCYTLRNHMLHYSYKDLSNYFGKFNQYSTLAARNKASKKNSVSILTILLIGPWTFIHQYLIKLNFLNGFQGFVWSLFSSYFAATKYIKLYELVRGKNM